MIDVDCVPTLHAIARYRRRMRMPRATFADVALVMAAGDLREHAPHGINVDLARDSEAEPFGYIVNGDVVFPVDVREQTGALVGITCLKARRRSKAEIRAFREMQREEFAA